MNDRLIFERSAHHAPRKWRGRLDALTVLTMTTTLVVDVIIVSHVSGPLGNRTRYGPRSSLLGWFLAYHKPKMAFRCGGGAST